MDTFEFFENFVQEDKKSTTNVLGFIEFCPQSNLKNLCCVQALFNRSGMFRVDKNGIGSCSDFFEVQHRSTNCT
jgi:hypothetical protein